MLAKYTKPEKDIEKENLKEREEASRRKENLQKKKRGQHKPCKEDEEAERELAIVATRGVVELFNSVSQH